MSRQLPPNPNLRNLKNQAKTILKRHRNGDALACEVLRQLRRFAGRPAADILGAEVSLTEVHYALALDYGFGSWEQMRRHVLSLAGRNARFRELLARARQVFTRKGPPERNIGSEAHKNLVKTMGEVLEGGEAGWEVAVELSGSERSRLRARAASLLGLRADPRSGEHLLRLMHDGNATVRRTALVRFASLVHRGSGGPEVTVLAGARHLAAAATDPDVRVRRSAIRSLSPYTGLGDPMIESTLQQALGDAAHRVAHEAARVLQTKCAGCGGVPARVPVAD